jgi:hypothetical protein
MTLKWVEKQKGLRPFKGEEKFFIREPKEMPVADREQIVIVTKTKTG